MNKEHLKKLCKFKTTDPTIIARCQVRVRNLATTKTSILGNSQQNFVREKIKTIDDEIHCVMKDTGLTYKKLL